MVSPATWQTTRASRAVSAVLSASYAWRVTCILIAGYLAYALVMLVVSRRAAKPQCSVDDGLFFVFIVPCLDEELVIGDSIQRLLALTGGTFAVLVVDDGSSDATSDVVAASVSERVWLHRRFPPCAREGKGAALNDAVAQLERSEHLAGRSTDKVIVSIVDADGRVEANAIEHVAPYFSDPSVGAVQIGVRMYNADEGVLARMQDFEFATFTEGFQRARHKIGSAGLGGNGQFTRLSALQAVGPPPWNDCLTEDLDLSIRMLASGWKISYCPSTWVSQQAVTDVRRLVRQRTRWFQGHVQCWRRLGTVLRSSLPARTSLDILHILLSPALVLVMSWSVLLLAAAVGLTAAVAPHRLWVDLLADHGELLGVSYVLSFGLAFPYAFVYRRMTPSRSFLRCLWWGHIYTFYGYIWFAAGWLAISRVLRRRTGWQKTARTLPIASVTFDDPLPVALASDGEVGARQ